MFYPIDPAEAPESVALSLAVLTIRLQLFETTSAFVAQNWNLCQGQ